MLCITPVPAFTFTGEMREAVMRGCLLWFNAAEEIVTAPAALQSHRHTRKGIIHTFIVPFMYALARQGIS